jgi:hypothetical protein
MGGRLPQILLELRERACSQPVRVGTAGELLNGMEKVGVYLLRGVGWLRHEVFPSPWRFSKGESHGRRVFHPYSRWHHS